MRTFFSAMNMEPSLIHHSAVSNPDHNHTRGITHFEWIPKHMEVSTRGGLKLGTSNESYQVVTCGSDGILKFWDVRAAYQSKPGFSVSKMYRNLDGKWEPFHSVEILSEDEKKSLSVTQFTLKESSKNVKQEEEPSPEEEDEPKKGNQFSTEYFAGCDDGRILCGNFKLYRDDTGKFKSYPPKYFKSPHSGPITALSMSPFISEVFLSTGSRTIAIWRHDVTATPVFARDMHTCITSAQWSDTRPAVFMLGYQDGSIEMWDLLDDIYDPVLIHYVSTTSIMAISVQTLTEEEHDMAVGDSEGIVYILSVSSSLWMPVDNELKLTTEFFEKEGLRSQSNVSDAGSSARAVGSVKKAEVEKRTDAKDETPAEEVLEKNYGEFLELEQIQLKYLGILKEEGGDEEEEEN